MRVRFFAGLRAITGCAEAEIPFEESAGALARLLCELYGEDMHKKIFAAGSQIPACASASREAANGKEENFSQEIMFLINGRHVNHLDGPATPLSPDDRVDVFPVVAGG